MLKPNISGPYIWLAILFALAVLSHGGCLNVATSEREVSVSEHHVLKPRELQGNLSGMWEYRQGEIVYNLLLDRHGNGGYDWQQGRFETMSLSQGQWMGKWVQTGNDREGNFEAQLAEDEMSARGRWWYTRIENDTDPLVPGGQFELIRKGGID